MNLRPRNLEESSLSRIMGHIKGERNFGVVSAFRGGLGKKKTWNDMPNSRMPFVTWVMGLLKCVADTKKKMEVL